MPRRRVASRDHQRAAESLPAHSGVPARAPGLIPGQRDDLAESKRTGARGAGWSSQIAPFDGAAHLACDDIEPVGDPPADLAHRPTAARCNATAQSRPASGFGICRGPRPALVHRMAGRADAGAVRRSERRSPDSARLAAISSAVARRGGKGLRAGTASRARRTRPARGYSSAAIVIADARCDDCEDVPVGALALQSAQVGRQRRRQQGGAFPPRVRGRGGLRRAPCGTGWMRQGVEESNAFIGRALSRGRPDGWGVGAPRRTRVPGTAPRPRRAAAEAGAAGRRSRRCSEIRVVAGAADDLHRRHPRRTASAAAQRARARNDLRRARRRAGASAR